MEDKKKYSEEEIIAILTGKLTKGFNMKSICEELNIDPYSEEAAYLSGDMAQ